MLGPVRMRAKALLLLLAVTVASGCFGSKRGPRGTNVGAGSNVDGPWSQGGQTQAAVENP